jgi:hypothetical protein
VELHKKAGIHAERYPLSGSSHFRGTSHDLDVYPFGKDEAPLVFEVKARKSGEGFAMLDKWLGDYAGLCLKRDRRLPGVYLSWETYVSLLAGKHVKIPDEIAEKSKPAQPPESPTP